MTTKRKLILGLCIAFLIVVASLCSIVFYYYAHPPALKSFLEKSISRSTRTLFTIKTLSYSLKPLGLQATGIVVEPLENAGGFHLEIPTLAAEMALEGPFGQRSLVLKTLRIDGFSLYVFKQINLPRFSPTAGKPSVLSRLLRRLAAVILFREVRFQAAEVVGGEITAELKDQIVKVSSFQASLHTERFIEISCSADLEWPAEKMRFTAPNLQISVDRVMSITDPEIPGNLRITNAVFRSQQAEARGMEIRARLTYKHSSRELLFKPADLAIEELAPRQQPGSEPIPINLNLNATGRWDLKENRLHAHGFQLTMLDMADLRGRLQASFGPQARISLELQEGDVFPQKLQRLLPEKVQQELHRLTWSGAVGLHGKVNGSRVEGQWIWHCDLKARLAENLIAYHRNIMKLGAKITGNIEAVGTFPLLRVSASLKMDKASFSGENTEIHPFKVRLSVSGEYPVFSIDELKADIPRADTTAGKRHISIDDIRVSARRGKLLADQKALIFPEILLTSSLVSNLLLSLKADIKDLDIAVRGEHTNLIGLALALKLVPTDWQLGGLDTLNLRVVRKNQGDVSFAAKWGLREVNFQNEDESYLGEGISIDTALEGKYRLATSSLTATGSLRVKGGEILLGRFYGDLKRNAFFSSVEARYDIPGKVLKLTGLKVGLKDIFALNINGSLVHKDQSPQVHLSLDMPRTPVRPPFQQLLVEPFESTTPSLANLNMGGDVSANIDLTGTGNQWLIEGHIRWRDGIFSSDDQNFSLEGIDLDLPIWFQNYEGEDSEKPLKGKLSVRSMAFPFIQKQPLKLKLAAEANRLFTKSPITLSVSGGQVHIGPVLGKGIYGSHPTIETSLDMEALDIKPLLGRIWTQPPEGSISARLDPVVLEGKSIKSAGEFRVKAFDGEIILSDLGMSGLFTPAPLIKFSAQVEDLNLGALTTGTSFGKVEGVLQGHIHGLEIANGQPQKFDLLLETIKTRGTPQMISVRAVDNISRIGGAPSPFMGIAKLFTAFLEQFPYRKIGVHATLKNDIFQINGTIKEDGKEYLVRRGTLWGVDVINQSTDNRASFRDMVKRIKRVTEGSKGPVVE